MAPIVRLLAALLPTLLLAGGSLAAQTERGTRVPLSRQRLEALAPDARTWLLPPPGLPGGPTQGKHGLEGLLAQRVRRDPLKQAVHGTGQVYEIHVRLAPEGQEVRVPAEDVLGLDTGWPGGPRQLRVLFWTETLRLRQTEFLVWRARLAEALSVPGLGRRETWILDGDGDGLFTSPGKDVLFIEETGWPPFPLSEVVLFATGAYELRVAADDRVRVAPFRGAMGVLRVLPELGEQPGLTDIVVGSGTVFRVLAAHVDPEPVTPGVWHLLSGRLACGLVFQKDLPAGGQGGASVLAGQEGVLQCGAPLTLDVAVRDRGDSLLLTDLKVVGRGGEVYAPDQSGSFQGEPLSLAVEVLVGRPGKERTRLVRPWAPWRVTREEGAALQPLELSTPSNWRPLLLRVTVKGGPMAGAQGTRKVR